MDFFLGVQLHFTIDQSIYLGIVPLIQFVLAAVLQ